MRSKWYVLHVLTGCESEVCRQLRGKGIDALVPRETFFLRRGGQWHEQTRTLFPGYVFVFMHYTIRMHYLIKEIPGAIRLLPKDKPVPLQQGECAWLLMCAGEGEDVLPPSKVDFNGDAPVVIDGPLLELEEYILKYDRHRRKVCLRIPVLGEGKDITLSILPV